MNATVEIEVAKPGELDAYWRNIDRDWRSALWNFRVIWHEQRRDIVARRGEAIAGALQLRIAASLGHIDAVWTAPEARRHGVGRALLARAEELANYYNCHKMTAAVLHGGDAQTFFERCDYRLEAVLPQHTFKLDVAMLRKFLL